MRVAGITPLQQKILKKVQLGFTYEEIAEELGESVYEIAYQEALAYSILNDRWKKPEIEVRKILSGMLLLFLSLFSVFESSLDHRIERAVRVRTGRVTRSSRREIKDLSVIDV